MQEMNNVVRKMAFKDGDDGNENGIYAFHIDVVNNGYILTITDEDGDYVYVEKDLEECLSLIRELG